MPIKYDASGQVEVEMCPQGSIAERLRAAGAGIPAFFTRTGYGTHVHQGGMPIKYDASGNVVESSLPRETRTFNGKDYLLEKALHGDIGLVKAWQADTFGNLRFRGTSMNFNPDAAMA